MENSSSSFRLKFRGRQTIYIYIYLYYIQFFYLKELYIYVIYIYIVIIIYLYRIVFSSFEQVVNIPNCHWIIELPFILDRFFGQKEIGLEHVVAFDG